MINWLLVDFNSYFASVEQQLDPRLRGRAVAVVPMLADSTCCIAASYEAKRFGVSTGTRVGDARRLCPGLRLIEARHGLYVDFHHRLVEAIESCVHVDSVLSIDEVACELPANFRTPERARKLAQAIKETIARQVGSCLRCSIGIAPNRFLAKTASDMQKPDGLVVLEPGDLPHRLYSLELRDLCGIGKNMERRLHAHGVRTVRQLCAATPAVLRRIWNGVEGERMHRLLRGEHVHETPTHRGTIGHSHVLPPRQRTHTDAWAVLHRLTQKAAMRLRAIHYLAGGAHVSIKYINHTRWAGEITCQETDDSLVFLRLIEQLWKRRPKESAPLAVGMTLLRLVAEDNHTPCLFPRAGRRQALNQTLDALNTHFGKNTIYFGGAHAVLESAPMRIAFTHIPDATEEKDAGSKQRRRKIPPRPETCG